MTDADLTFEKLEINKRLMGVETAVALLGSKIEDLKTSKNEIHLHLLEEIKKMGATLYGLDGADGIVTKVHDLEIKSRDHKEQESRATTQRMTIWGSLLVLFIERIWHWIEVLKIK